MSHWGWMVPSHFIPARSQHPSQATLHAGMGVHVRSPGLAVQHGCTNQQQNWRYGCTPTPTATPCHHSPPTLESLSLSHSPSPSLLPFPSLLGSLLCHCLFLPPPSPPPRSDSFSARPSTHTHTPPHQPPLKRPVGGNDSGSCEPAQVSRRAPHYHESCLKGISFRLFPRKSSTRAGEASETHPPTGIYRPSAAAEAAHGQ